ncbi:Protein fat-free homolog [Nesidiocoris tenuis]|uniref:Vacuolar protein sorting-associated protein 51 homolog n=1 Tax=Nesidiocoris tenuis TaxID=355587 RepID=A0ABN7B0F0_9HEMI|nr:Protein fat-free homolog [Nesidiocoris tenuis]
MFLQKLLKEHTLKEIMDQEDIIVKETQGLHSDMQTLVYENYNKFISATDTIRKMKVDFKKMEAEMDSLGKNMDSITTCSDKISTTLQKTRGQISKLSGVHALLKRLQFLFKLPAKLNSLMDEEKYAQAVEDYLRTQQVLHHYSHLESFLGIQEECNAIVADLKDRLHNQYKNPKASAKEMTDSIELLLKLGESPEELHSEFLKHAAIRFEKHGYQLTAGDSTEDLVEFIDLANNGFLCDLCQIVAAYHEMFLSHRSLHMSETATAMALLDDFVELRMSEWFTCISNKIRSEQEDPQSDTMILVRALDRFYSKLSSVSSLLKTDAYARRGLNLVLEACRRQCSSQRESLESSFSDWVRGVRQSVGEEQNQTTELLAGLIVNIVEKVKAALNQLSLFIQPDRSFTAENEFLQNFSLNCVRTGLVVEFLKHIVRASVVFTKPIASPSLPTLLVLAKMCMEFSSSHIHYLIGLVDEWFNIKLTKEREDEEEELTRLMEGGAQDLVNHYVRMQGNIISQMVRKSIETRDWCQSLEPRTVRPVIKRILEELATSDTCLGSLFEEGERPSQPGSASRHHRSMVSGGSAVWSSGSTQSYTHNLNKLFSDKIEIYSPVSLTKTSVLTGVIKIALKTLLECIRLKTFSKYGLQQIQVDAHYLQQYLWKYVADENLVQLLLEEVLSSAVHRCTDPELMEPSVVEIICERGIQEIATWEEPAESVLALFLVNCAFWVLSFFHWRFYGVLFSVLFLMVLHEAWVDHIWPEIRVAPPPVSAVSRPDDLPLDANVREGMLTLPEISHYATGFRAAVSGQYARLRLLRQTQPPLYCVIVSTGCLIAVRVGSLISSSALLYLLVMALLTVPGFVKHALPPKLKQRILETVRTVAAVVVPADVNVDEYLPDATTEENVALLNRAGNNCDLSPPSSDDSSIADLLIPGVEDSLDATDNFLPTIPQESESRESSDSEDALRFRPTHFNGSTTKGAMPAHDDSTDDEGSLLKELDFSSVNPATTPSKAGLSGLTDIVASALYRTVPKAFTPANSVFKKLDNDDSDSDFEIIENDDAS